MKEKEFERWEKYHKIGKLRFILLYSLYFVIVLNLVDFLSKFMKDKFVFEIDGFFVRLIIGGLCGLFSGSMMWNGKEREYNKYIDKNNDNELI